jgi:hypothetical protein
MMPEPDFWKLIAQSRKAALAEDPGDGDELLDLQSEALQALLVKLSPQQIIDYHERFHEVSGRLYRWDIWGAAYWMHGGCSDDGFIDFRSTLISLGKERFEQTLADADSLAELVDAELVPYLQGEGFQYIAPRAYMQKTGQEMPMDFESTQPDEPLGERCDFDDAEVMAERFPKLIAKLPEMGD